MRVRNNGIPAAEDFAAITVVVREVNRPSVLTSIGAKSLAEMDTLTLTASATDPDLPASALRFRLDDAEMRSFLIFHRAPA